MSSVYSFTVISTAPDGEPVVHRCATEDEEAQLVDELRAAGHTGIETTETHDHRFLGRYSWLTLRWTRPGDDGPAGLEAGHEVYVRIRPNGWRFHAARAEPHPRGGLAVPYVPYEETPSPRLLWQRSSRADRWRELVAWPAATLLVWFVGVCAVFALPAAVLALIAVA